MLEDSYHTRPSRMGKLLVKEVLPVPFGISHQQVEQVFQAGGFVHQKFPCPFTFDQGAETVFFQGPETGKKAFALQREFPNRYPLVQVGGDQAEKCLMHLLVQVKVVCFSPQFADLSDFWLGVFLYGMIQKQFPPVIALILSFMCLNDPVQNLGMDFVLMV